MLPTGNQQNKTKALIKTDAPGLTTSTSLDLSFALTVPIGKMRNLRTDPLTGKTRAINRFTQDWIFIALGAFTVLALAGLFVLATARHIEFSFRHLLTSISYTLAPIIILLLKKSASLTIKMQKDGYYSTTGPLTDLLFTITKEQNNRRWSELECVRFQKAEGLSAQPLQLFGHCDCLVMEWQPQKRRATAPRYSASYIPFSILNEDQREQLLRALSLFVPQELLSPEVLYLQVKTLSGATNKDLSSFTQVWLEQYTHNFELCNYVTLAPGSALGNGRFIISMLFAARINSSIYLATSSTQEKVVIKELIAPIDSDEPMQIKLVEQFNREAALLAQLRHPGIISVIDHFIQNGRSYIVMKHSTGTNLREYIRAHGAFSEAESIKIAAQLASVLHYLHHQNPPILHRDFTPDNFIYDNDGSVTVIDFGAANVYNTGKTATLIGKQSYMPPEQLRGKPSPASDIYAFGATLAFLLTGKDLPSMGKLPVFENVEICPEFVSLIQKCTSFDHCDRPTSDQILTELAPNGMLASRAAKTMPKAAI